MKRKILVAVVLVSSLSLFAATSIRSQQSPPPPITLKEATNVCQKCGKSAHLLHFMEANQDEETEYCSNCFYNGRKDSK